MAGINVERVVEEFTKFELDPEAIGTAKIHEDLLAIKQTLDLSTTAHCRQANATVSSLIQAIGFKAARCHYWERILSDQLRLAKLGIKHQILESGELKSTASNVNIAEERAEFNSTVAELSKRLSSAAASRYFWQHMEDILHEVAKRIDSSAASLGVEAKLGSR